MKIKNGRVFFLFLFFCFGFSCGASRQPDQNTDNLDRESIEKFLKTAKDISVEKDRGRRTEAWEVNLDDGKKQGKGFFKVTDRDWSNPSGGDSYRYVIASYELDKLLDLNLVPPTVERKIQRKKGSLMMFLESSVISEEDRRQQNLVPPNPEDLEKTLCDLVVFEHLIFFPSLCNQRDLGNILIQTDLGWKVWFVDLSEAFAPSMKLIPGCEIQDCSDSLFQKIESLSRDRVENKLSPYLNDTEISALFARRELIIKKVKEIKAEKNS